MSKRQILAALKKKNIYPVNVEYQRSCPTPSGYASGWDIELSDEAEIYIGQINPDIEVSTFMEFDSLEDVLEWINEI
jgi:hypothetical protein